MNRIYLIGGGVVAALVGTFLLWPKATPPEVVPPRVESAAVPAPETNYPVPASDGSSAALPELESSDARVLESAKSVLNTGAIERWLIPNDIVRRVVATIDNLPRKKYAERLKPLKAVPARFEVEGAETDLTLAAGNSARYATFVDLVQALDMQKVTKEYFKLYPLFQQAYRDLGYPDSHFNNRVVQAIDDLLAAPTITTPIKLVQPNVLYEFADPKLESLSAGQKIMIRIGADNQAKVKAKLRELRAAIVAGK